jgi:very-short-patch-repair endonuclease
MHSIQIGLVVLVIVALGALKVLSLSKGGAAKAGVYYLRKSIFSPAERSFLGILNAIGYEGVSIESKVRLADIFGIKKGLGRGDRQRALNRITSKHVDFLFVQKSDGRPILGIELDDGSHNEEDRIERDEFVDSVFASAGLSILHFTAKAAYDPMEVRRSIDQALAVQA